MPEKQIDFTTLVEQFVALKQEVNLQTRATRNSLEQNAESLKRLAELSEVSKTPSAPAPEPTEDRLKPLFRAMIDVYDSLALARKQVEKQRDSFDSALESLQEGIELPPLPPVSETISTPVAAASFWSRLWGRREEEVPLENPLLAERIALDEWRNEIQTAQESAQSRVEQTAQFIDEALTGLLTGYEMSLSRIDKLLSQFEFRPILAEGETFDPELMEAVEVIRDSGEPAGTVIEELRRGYVRGGIVFRYAQVKVAR